MDEILTLIMVNSEAKRWQSGGYMVYGIAKFQIKFFFFFCSDGGGAVNNTGDVSSSFGDFMKNIATEIYRNCKSEP